MVPSYDMSALYATDDLGNVVRRIDPFTGQPGDTIPVFDPYNMYFTPDGKYAISVAEAYRTLVWYDPATWQETDRVRYPDCKGIDHGDFTPDGRIAVFSCEFDGRVVVIDMQTRQLIRVIDMPTRNYTDGPAGPADRAGRFEVLHRRLRFRRRVGAGQGPADRHRHIATGTARTACTSAGTPSSCTSPTGTRARSACSTPTPATRSRKWQLPGGGSPDMGNVSADGSQLWLSGRYHAVVYVISTADGSLISRSPSGTARTGWR